MPWNNDISLIRFFKGRLYRKSDFLHTTQAEIQTDIKWYH